MLMCHLSKTCSLKGKISNIPNGLKPVYSFLGVPYAQPPIARLRFMPPEPLQLWYGERDATKYGAICPQNLKAAAKIHYPYPVPDKVSEDCLFLNVWTPDLIGKLSVMVWIHGGAFIQGKNIVLVG